MNNVEKSEYLNEGIRSLQEAIRTENPLVVAIKFSLRVRLKKVLEGTRGMEIYDALVNRLISINLPFQEEELLAISDAIKVSSYPSYIDVFPKELFIIDLGI
ncbi:hypothetical protein SOP85_05005 [Pseudomonas sp. YuFO20]|jgi:hypothetical protein|uniref:hypothetical protein n=1 Tax=Pseudomonas sp. YuFO20 TaxID=3095362 RepID=UPI002B252E54|nr:hypothetical protein [Pseudomonas sp. YuFO20]MEB2514793.1 hypothetical protein [Pseudomonas sp. YuFO20]